MSLQLPAQSKHMQGEAGGTGRRHNGAGAAVHARRVERRVCAAALLAHALPLAAGRFVGVLLPLGALHARQHVLQRVARAGG